MNAADKIIAGFTITTRERLDRLKASWVTPDSAPTYSYLDRRDGLGR